MTHLDSVTETYKDLPYMTHEQAELMRDLIVRHDCKDVLEIGFLHGKSSAYIAAILEDLGRGRLVTIDLKKAREREPSIDTVLATVGLSHRVTPVFAHRSYTWEMAKMIQAEPRPQFDLCYFDGGHTWDDAGFGFLLVDMLLRPGGWIIFDDLKWTLADSVRKGEKLSPRWRHASRDEMAAAGVGMVFDYLVPHLGYTEMRTLRHGWWGIARKPLERSAAGAPFRRRDGIAARVRRKVAVRTRLRALAGRVRGRAGM